MWLSLLGSDISWFNFLSHVFTLSVLFHQSCISYVAMYDVMFSKISSWKIYVKLTEMVQKQ